MRSLAVILVSILLIVVLVGAITTEYYLQKWTPEYHLTKKAKKKKGDPLPLPPDPPDPPPPINV